MKKSTWAWTAVGVALAGALVWAFMPRPIEVETATVRRGLFEQAIEEDGRTRVHDRFTISAPVAARLARISLHVGDPVAAGDTVAVLTPVMSAMVDERSVREASARLKAAAAAVERASARVARARIAQQEATLEQQRAEKLATEGFVSASRVDSVRLALAGARRELEMANAEREMAVQEQAAAATVLQPVNPGGAQGRALTVRSPVAGVVLRIAQPSEATIPAGAALVDVGDPARMEVVSELLTTDAVQAQPGRPVLIERWGGPPVEGVVRRVEPAAFTKVSALGIEEQRVNVLIDLRSPPAVWRAMGDGFRVSVRIVTASVPDAVLVPVGALFPHGTGMAVYKLDGGRARLHPVDVAARNSATASIRNNLSAGDVVILYPPTTLADGKRVRLRTGA